MNIQTAFDKAFLKAVKNDENVDSGMEDHMNWDFVEADMWMDLAKMGFKAEDISAQFIAFEDTIDEYLEEK
tara:strand:- start:234 stop:446 length:213 start_codon:yes stop_codon:yes gene_type:complete